MRILFAVNFPKVQLTGNEIFLYAWDRFAKRNQGKLDCDLIFVTNGWSESEILNIVKTGPVKVVNNSPAGIWLNYPTIVDVGSGYDFVFRMDEDAFTTADNINKLCAFIRDNPEIDFISASNNKRPVICTDNQEVDKLIHQPHLQNPNCASYAPWNQAGYNGDLYGIKRSFFLRAFENYKRDPRCGFNHTLMTWDLSFEHVCQTLNYDTSEFTPAMKKAKVFWDGGWSTDLWTHMCALEINMAGITSEEGISFHNKNILKKYLLAKNYSSYSKVKDEIDISFPRKLNVAADHIFHIENGYTINWFFNTMINGQLQANPATGGIVEMLRGSNHSSFFANLYCIVEYLTEISQQQHLIDKLKYSMEMLDTHHHIDLDNIRSLKSNLIDFYSEALIEYMP